jgi:hypothetical protein
MAPATSHPSFTESHIILAPETFVLDAFGVRPTDSGAAKFGNSNLSLQLRL